MTSPMSRRLRAATTAAAVVGLVLTGCAPTAPSDRTATPAATLAPATLPESPPDADATASVFAELEERFDARLGVHAVDTGTGTEVAWRDGERFAYASTIKAVAAGALLHEVGVEGLSTRVQVEAGDIVPHSPVTETRIGTTMTLGEVAHAALTVSDNAAANLMLDALGGPAELDAALTDLGDETTVVARTEPDLNDAVPGDDRDTSTPRALSTDLREYLLGETSTSAEREQLETWMTATETGDTLVRADLPQSWTVGDKSGSGDYGTRNDLAIVRPPGRAPIIIAVLSSRDERDADRDDRLVAEAAAAAIAAMDKG